MQHAMNKLTSNGNSIYEAETLFLLTKWTSACSFVLKALTWFPKNTIRSQFIQHSKNNSWLLSPDVTNSSHELMSTEISMYATGKLVTITGERNAKNNSLMKRFGFTPSENKRDAFARRNERTNIKPWNTSHGSFSVHDVLQFVSSHNLSGLDSVPSVPCPAIRNRNITTGRQHDHCHCNLQASSLCKTKLEAVLGQLRWDVLPPLSLVSASDHIE